MREKRSESASTLVRIVLLFVNFNSEGHWTLYEK